MWSAKINGVLQWIYIYIYYFFLWTGFIAFESLKKQVINAIYELDIFCRCCFLWAWFLL
jgi:hypothetical protein